MFTFDLQMLYKIMQNLYSPCVIIYTTKGNKPKQRKRERKMFETRLVKGLKEDFGITTAKHNETIKILAKQYIRGEISKQGLTNILKGFAQEK